MESWLVATLLFSALLIVLFLGLPVSFACGGIAAIACLFIWGPQGYYSLVSTTYAEMTSFVFIAVPLFILMAEILSFSGIAEDLFELVHKWMGPLRGGLAMGAMLACAVFAAMVGVSTAATATMGVVAGKPMMDKGYNKRLAVGTIAAGGALGILIPPSIIMIIFGSVAEISIGQLFMAGMIPGVILTVIFIGYIGIKSYLTPNYAPPVPLSERVGWREKFRLLTRLVPATFIVMLVLGSIYLGICTPTEAAGIGALGSLLVAAGMKRLTWSNFFQALQHTMNLTAMILWITIGAVSFTLLVTVTGISDWFREAVIGLELNRWVILLGIQVVYIIMGCFLDPVGIIMITTPVFLPLISALGFDLLWYGLLFVITMEMAYITPPFGFNLFVLRGIMPRSITIIDIYKGIIPFVICQILCLGIMIAFPDLVTWLPRLLIK